MHVMLLRSLQSSLIYPQVRLSAKIHSGRKDLLNARQLFHGGVKTRTGYSIEENTRHALWPPKPKLFFMALRIFMARGWNGT